jgi:hypothetical protein
VLALRRRAAIKGEQKSLVQEETEVHRCAATTKTEPGPRPVQAEGNHEVGAGKIASAKRDSRDRTEAQLTERKWEWIECRVKNENVLVRRQKQEPNQIVTCAEKNSEINTATSDRED